MSNGACENFIDALLSKFSATDNLRALQKNAEDSDTLGGDGPLTVDVLKQCFSADRRYWEWTLEELSESLQPLDSRVRMFSSELARKRTYYRQLLLSRLEVLQGILREKKLRNLPISDREASCVARLTDLRDAEDPVQSRATERFQQLMKAVHQKDEDEGALRWSAELYPAKSRKQPDSDSALQLESLLEAHNLCLQELGSAPRPPHLYTKDVRLAAIINAVEAEQRQADKRRKKEPAGKADKLKNLSAQRKPARKRQHQQQQQSAEKRGKHASSREITRFPPSFYQYIRGFFNLLRLLLLEMVSPEEESLNTEQICELVNAWQSTPRAQRTNSPWINRCPDWSLVAAHALKLLSTSGRGCPLARLVASSHAADQQIRLPPRGFVAYNEKYDTWYWLGGSGGGGQPAAADGEAETALLARLFSIWAKVDSGAGGLRDVWAETGGHAFEAEYSLRRPSPSPRRPPKRSRAPPNDGSPAVGSSIGGDDDSEFSYEDEEEEGDDLRVSSSSVARGGRQKNASSKPQRVTEHVPPPYFPTEWECRLSTMEQRRSFQNQEIQRFSQPWSPFVYNQHGYASVVGPVRTASVNFAGRGSGRAREHPLLRSDRPAWLSQCISSALDRLQVKMYEEEMAVRADRFNDMMYTASSSASYGGGGRRARPPAPLSRPAANSSFGNHHRIPEYIPDIEELTSVDDPFYYQQQDMQARSYGRHGRPAAGADAFYEEEEEEEEEGESDEESDSRGLDDEEDFAFASQQQQQSRGLAPPPPPPPARRDGVSSAAADGVDGIAEAGDRFFSEPRRMMLHYRPR